LTRLTPESAADPGRLLPLLRRELQHVADLLDPEFGYQATLPPGVAASPHGRVVRDRYRVLWDTWVDGRLVRRGVLPATAREDRLADFARALGDLGETLDAVFGRIFGATRLTHRALMALAAGRHAVDAEGGPPAPDRADPQPPMSPPAEASRSGGAAASVAPRLASSAAARARTGATLRSLISS
jgi:hypothetical protein